MANQTNPPGFITQENNLNLNNRRTGILSNTNGNNGNNFGNIGVLNMAHRRTPPGMSNLPPSGHTTLARSRIPYPREKIQDALKKVKNNKRSKKK